jgi:DNA invertase Pin-like site-specific DNA recombinase
MTLAAAYIRESTIAQGDRYGPDAQRAAIKRAIADLEIELVTEYSDLISGTGALKRSDFQRMVTDARGGRFSVLVVYDTSRFARNEADAFTYEATLRAAGARIYYAREGLWSDDRRGALQKGILHVLNAQYSRDLTDRIRDGYAAKFARLGLPGATLPWAIAGPTRRQRRSRSSTRRRRSGANCSSSTRRAPTARNRSPTS